MQHLLQAKTGYKLMKETKTPTEDVGDQNVGKLKLPYSVEEKKSF